MVMPCLQKKLQMLSDNILQVAYFLTCIANRLGYSNGLKPELGILVSFLYMNMRWFTSLVAIKEKPMTINPQHCWHYSLLSPFCAPPPLLGSSQRCSWQATTVGEVSNREIIHH